MKIKIPFYKQHTCYTCGPTSLHMVLSFLGDHKGELPLEKEAHTNHEVGTRHRGMIDTACKEGFYCYVNSNSSLNEIKHFIHIGLPVIVDVTEIQSNTGHYAVITGFDGKSFLMNDPWNGKNYKLSERKFLEYWQDSLTHSHKLIMAMSKKNFELGKQYLPY